MPYPPPPVNQLAKDIADVDLFAKSDAQVLPHAGQEAGEFPILGHEALGAVYEHGDEVRGWIGFEDESRDTPFEVAEGGGGMLVDAAFGEDVDPGEVRVRVGGRGGG